MIPPRVPKANRPDRHLPPFVLDDLADSLVLGQRDQDIGSIGPRIDYLRRLGSHRIKGMLLLLCQANGHGPG